MRGPMGTGLGLLSRNECIELLPRQAVHDSPQRIRRNRVAIFVKPGASVPLC